MRSVQIPGSVHAQRDWTSSAWLATDGFAFGDTLADLDSGNLSISHSPSWAPFAPRALPRFDATMGPLTPERPVLRTGRFLTGNPAHERLPNIRSGLPASRVRPSEHSVLNHRGVSRRRFNTQPLSVAGFRFRSRLRQSTAGSPDATAETGSSSYGLLIHFQLLSTSFHKDAVTFSYRPECACLKGTLTPPTKHARRRTVAPGDCSPGAPADPDVQVSRIRFLK